jgi:membrane protease YdiL (CAAX protease family)
VLVLYTLAYVAYLAWRPEGELLHWLTLVALPLGLLRRIRRARDPESSWRDLLRSVGLGARPSPAGLAAALVAGGALCAVQLLGRNGPAILELFRSGRALWLWPASFFLMVVTAAGTEELFFRGLLQRRLGLALGSRWLAIGAAAALFALYHVPYAYHVPEWGTQGDLAGAIRAAAATGLPLGVLLGVVFALAGDNLLPAVLAHALINSLPGMVAIQRVLAG